MITDNARILVIGAGVNGSAVTTVLHNGGLDVKVLARGKRYEDIQNEGIIIEDPFSHKRTITKVPVIDHLDPEDIYDFILVVVRKNQLADLLPVLAHEGVHIERVKSSECETQELARIYANKILKVFEKIKASR